MDSSKNGNLTRRRFIQGMAGATVGCASFSSDRSVASGENAEQGGKGKEHLAAACGTYCGACPAYIATHGEGEPTKRPPQKASSGPAEGRKGIPPSNWMDGLRCDGCLSGGVLAGHCKFCNIRLCAANKQKDSRCTDCEELPCIRITTLINMQGGYLHRKEYLPNLKKIREMGVQEWIKKEEERWRCPRCGLPMRWYDAECSGCGEPRSERLFPLT